MYSPDSTKMVSDGGMCGYIGVYYSTSHMNSCNILQLQLVLLRGLDVDSNLYVLGDLIDHSMELIAGIDFSKNMENILEAASFKLGITAADEQEQRVQIREQLKSLYVDERSTFAIQGIRSGLSLGGKLSMRDCAG